MSMTRPQAQPSDDLFTRLIKSAEQRAAPVELWEPEHCGEIDIEILADGRWRHEGAFISRDKLVRLFASVLRRDADGAYYLVTPVEKMRIRVERAPFVATELTVAGEGADQILSFTTNVGDRVIAGPDHPIRVETKPLSGEPAPFVHVRGRLEAALSRPVYYQLAELTEPAGGRMIVRSQGAAFDLGPAA